MVLGFGFFPIFVHSVNQCLSAFHLTWPKQLCPQSRRFAEKATDNTTHSPSGMRYASMATYPARRHLSHGKDTIQYAI